MAFAWVEPFSLTSSPPTLVRLYRPLPPSLSWPKMMENDNAAIYWLILATSISSVTTAMVYLFKKCCGQIWANIGSICFQNFAASLELREETFKQVTNLLIFPRIFQQLQLQTFKVIWNHDANAQTGDFVQWGWMRLPTKSYLLSFLAICGVTHYVFIPYDLKSVEIVGPADAVATLIDLSNVAATTSLTETQLETLRHTFGMGDSWTKADKVCTRWERRFVVLAFSTCYIGIASKLESNEARLIVAVIGVVPAVLCACWYNILLARSALSLSPWRRRFTLIDEENVLAQSMLELADNIPQPTTIAGVPDSGALPGTNQAAVFDALEILHETSPTVYGSSKIVYSVLTARGYYYEVVKQTQVIPRADELIVRFAQEAQMYAVQLRSNFVHHLAERTAIPDHTSLHICTHNPMVDPYITELYQNFKKGVDLENLLMIILPPLQHFNSCLTSPLLPRSRTATCTQFVTTMSDFETLLLQMTAGFMLKLVFVLPIDADT